MPVIFVTCYRCHIFILYTSIVSSCASFLFLSLRRDLTNSRIFNIKNCVFSIIEFDPPNQGCWIWVFKSIWKQIWHREMEDFWTTQDTFHSALVDVRKALTFFFLYVLFLYRFLCQMLSFLWQNPSKQAIISKLIMLRFAIFAFHVYKEIFNFSANIEYWIFRSTESTHRIQQKDKFSWWMPWKYPALRYYDICIICCHHAAK